MNHLADCPVRTAKDCGDVAEISGMIKKPEIQFNYLWTRERAVAAMRCRITFLPSMLPFLQRI